MSTLCALPGCESEQNPRVCLSQGCGALFHHSCAQRVCEEWEGWDTCLKCWLEERGRGAEFAAICAAAAAPQHVPQSEWLDGLPPEEEEDPPTLTDTASLHGTATASLLSSSLFSGGVIKLTPEEEATFRGRPFFSALQEMASKRTAPVHHLYRSSVT
jgi:hypothetical protein